MRKIVFIVLVTLTSTFVYSQPNKSQHLKAFNQAKLSRDFNTGIIALNYYLAEQGANNPYADTLAMLYLEQGAYLQCYYWVDKRFQSKPDDNTLLEMKAICLDKLQQPVEAIDIYDKLFKKTQNPYHAYKLMELQYNIKRLAECVATAATAEKLQYKPDYIMTYTLGNKTEKTALLAGVYNIHGLALYDLDRKAEAKTYFEKAIALDSNFVLARQNIETIKILEANSNNKVNPNNSNPVSPGNKQN